MGATAKSKEVAKKKASASSKVVSTPKVTRTKAKELEVIAKAQVIVEPLVPGRVRGRPKILSKEANTRLAALIEECKESIAEDPHVHTFFPCSEIGADSTYQGNCGDCQFSKKYKEFLNNQERQDYPPQTTFFCLQCSFHWRSGLYFVCRQCRKPYPVADNEDAEPLATSIHTTVLNVEEPRVDQALQQQMP